MIETAMKMEGSLPKATDIDVAILLSGGVDSAVVPKLLIDQGFDPKRMVAFRFKLWAPEPEEKTECQEQREMQDAKKIADHYGILFVPLYWEKLVYDAVYGPAFKDYFLGITPNPDMACNEEIKFGVFANYAFSRLGALYVATGHHVRTRNNPFRLLCGKDPDKDQSYFLGRVKREVLARCRFPVGEYLKNAEIKKMAREFGVPNEIIDKPSSKDWCFVAKRQSEKDTNPAKFTLEELLLIEGKKRNMIFVPGPIIDEHGREVGRHNGVMLYAMTIGQKVGFKDGFGVPGGNGRIYVSRKDILGNILYVAPSQPVADVVVVRNLNWFTEFSPIFPLRCSAKIRTPQKAQSCRVEKTGEDEIRMYFDTPQNSVAPGQACVLYDGEAVLGGGVIVS